MMRAQEPNGKVAVGEGWRLSRKRSRGFSLVEALIVITIIGIIVTMSIAYVVGARPAQQLERGEVAVTAFFNRARNMAVSDEASVRVQFDVANNQYWIQELDRATATWNTVSEIANLPEGIVFLAGGNTFPGQEIVFTSRGSLTAGGSVTIVNSTGDATIISGNVASGRFELTGGNMR